MAKDWPYALMSKEASKNGGPEEWLESVKRDSYNDGYESGVESAVKECLVPTAIICTGIGVALTICVQNIFKRIKTRKWTRQIEKQDAAVAEELLKEELSNSLNEFDAEREEQDS